MCQTWEFFQTLETRETRENKSQRINNNNNWWPQLRADKTRPHCVRDKIKQKICSTLAATKTTKKTKQLTGIVVDVELLNCCNRFTSTLAAFRLLCARVRTINEGGKQNKIQFGTAEATIYDSSRHTRAIEWNHTLPVCCWSWMCGCVHLYAVRVWVCVWERERGKENERESAYSFTFVMWWNECKWKCVAWQMPNTPTPHRIQNKRNSMCSCLLTHTLLHGSRWLSRSQYCS